MNTQNRRASHILAAFAAGVNHAAQRDAQLKAVVAITTEVERHANAIDPRHYSAVSVLVDLVVELAQGMRHLAHVMDTDAHPAPVIVEGPEWPASLCDDEVTP